MTDPPVMPVQANLSPVLTRMTDADAGNDSREPAVIAPTTDEPVSDPVVKTAVTVDPSDPVNM